MIMLLLENTKGVLLLYITIIRYALCYMCRFDADNHCISSCRYHLRHRYYRRHHHLLRDLEVGLPAGYVIDAVS